MPSGFPGIHAHKDIDWSQWVMKRGCEVCEGGVAGGEVAQYLSEESEGNR